MFHFFETLWYDPFIEAEDELLRYIDKQELTFKRRVGWDEIIIYLIQT